MQEKDLYLPNHYANIGGMLSTGMPFIICIGGRGTGKTYGALKLSRDLKLNTLLMRRTAAQAGIISSDSMSPWKSIARDEGFEIKTESAAKGLSVTNEVDEDGNVIRALSYQCALSTISNLRGFDSSDIDLIIYDEFIPETHEKKMKHELDALLNAYETINRNRELSGKPATKLMLLANANNLASPILSGLHLTNKVESMIKKHQAISIMPEKGVAIFLLQDSPISQLKSETALYRLTKGTAFSEMALSNEFSYSDTSNVISLDLKNMQPIFTLDQMTIYFSNQSMRFYVSAKLNLSVPIFKSISDEDIARLKTVYSWFTLNIISARVDYESFEIKSRILEVFL